MERQGYGQARIRRDRKVERQMCRLKDKEGYRERYETKRDVTSPLPCDTKVSKSTVLG